MEEVQTAEQPRRHILKWSYLQLETHALLWASISLLKQDSKPGTVQRVFNHYWASLGH